MDVITLLDQIRIIALNGLHYTRDVYDRDRYERLLSLCTQTYQDCLGVPAGEVRERFLAEMGHVTTKVGAEAAIFNQQGEILLMERSDGTGWCLPCGWVEPGESPEESAVRETREETGLEVAVERLVGVYTRKASLQDGLHGMVAVVHLCRITGGALRISPEGLDLRYWPIGEVPRWHSTHEEYARGALAAWQASGQSTVPPGA